VWVVATNGKSYLLSFTTLFTERGYVLGVNIKSNILQNQEYLLESPIHNTHDAVRLEDFKSGVKVKKVAGKLSPLRLAEMPMAEGKNPEVTIAAHIATKLIELQESLGVQLYAKEVMHQDLMYAESTAPEVLMDEYTRSYSVALDAWNVEIKHTRKSASNAETLEFQLPLLIPKELVSSIEEQTFTISVGVEVDTEETVKVEKNFTDAENQMISPVPKKAAEAEVPENLKETLRLVQILYGNTVTEQVLALGGSLVFDSESEKLSKAVFLNELDIDLVEQTVSTCDVELSASIEKSQTASTGAAEGGGIDRTVKSSIDVPVPVSFIEFNTADISIGTYPMEHPLIHAQMGTVRDVLNEPFSTVKNGTEYDAFQPLLIDSKGLTLSETVHSRIYKADLAGQLRDAEQFRLEKSAAQVYEWSSFNHSVEQSSLSSSTWLSYTDIGSHSKLAISSLEGELSQPKKASKAMTVRDTIIEVPSIAETKALSHDSFRDEELDSAFPTVEPLSVSLIGYEVSQLRSLIQETLQDGLDTATSSSEWYGNIDSMESSKYEQPILDGYSHNASVAKMDREQQASITSAEKAGVTREEDAVVAGGDSAGIDRLHEALNLTSERSYFEREENATVSHLEKASYDKSYTSLIITSVHGTVRKMVDGHLEAHERASSDSSLTEAVTHELGAAEGSTALDILLDLPSFSTISLNDYETLIEGTVPASNSMAYEGLIISGVSGLPIRILQAATSKISSASISHLTHDVYLHDELDGGKRKVVDPPWEEKKEDIWLIQGKPYSWSNWMWKKTR
jgi:hypothetical protein